MQVIFLQKRNQKCGKILYYAHLLHCLHGITIFKKKLDGAVSESKLELWYDYTTGILLTTTPTYVIT